MHEAGNKEIAGERMRVEVKEQRTTFYRGTLTNQPSSTDDPKQGINVWFQPRHIIDVLAADE
jgi:hypothetical protein